VHAKIPKSAVFISAANGPILLLKTFDRQFSLVFTFMQLFRSAVIYMPNNNFLYNNFFCNVTEPEVLRTEQRYAPVIPVIADASKCGKNKQVSLMFFPHFDVLISLNRRTATWNLFVLYSNETNYYSFFYFKIFLNYSKADLCPLRRTQKPSHLT